MSPEPASGQQPVPRPNSGEPRVSARAVVLNGRGEVLLIRHHDHTRDFHVLPGVH